MWMFMGVEAESLGTFSLSNYSLPHKGKYCAFEEIKTEALRFPVYGASIPPRPGRHTRACILDGLSQRQL